MRMRMAYSLFQPRRQILPSVAEKIRQSNKTPAVVYEELRLTVGPSSAEQLCYSPVSKAQVKNIKRTAKAKEGKSDIYQELLRLCHETKDVHLLMFSPNMPIVSVSSS